MRAIEADRMTIEEWLRMAEGWRDTDEAPGELIRALAAEVERLRAVTHAQHAELIELRAFKARS
jgi:hypothetical protein